MIYYQDEWVTLWHGACEDVLPDIAAADVSLVLTDPPYGVGERTDRKTRKRGSLAECNNFPLIQGDDTPFDPSHLLRFSRLVLFGANHYAQSLPPSSSWIVWDKRAGLQSKRGDAFNDNGDAEMAWSNVGGPVRVYSHLWMGMLKASERDERRTHPTQKPVALMARIIETYTKPGDLILDPYAGTGAVLVAAKSLGRRSIGVEVEQQYCRVAALRLSQSVMDFTGALP